MVNFPDKYECTLKPALKTDFSHQTARVHKTLLIVKHDQRLKNNLYINVTSIFIFPADDLSL